MASQWCAVNEWNIFKLPLSPFVYFLQVSGVTVEVALQWCADAFSDNIIGFVNSIKTVDGGTHIDGLKAALTRTGGAGGWDRVKGEKPFRWRTAARTSTVSRQLSRAQVRGGWVG